MSLKLLPNLLSVSRIILVFPIILLFVYEKEELSFLIFVVASITDYLDGYFARKFNVESSTGALLDILGDKIMVTMLLVWFTFFTSNILVLISTMIILFREISVIILRLHLVANDNFNLNQVKSDFLGKTKTTLQFISIAFLFFIPLVSNFYANLIFLFLLFCSFISCLSLFKYFFNWYLREQI